MPLKFPINSYDTYKSLPFREFSNLKYAIYVIDYNWTYLYTNEFGADRLNGFDIVNKNITEIWKAHPEFNFEPIHNALKGPVEKRTSLSLTSRSPITKKIIEISGYPLKDCYFFSVSELPEKNDLLSELKTLIGRG